MSRVVRKKREKETGKERERERRRDRERILFPLKTAPFHL